MKIGGMRMVVPQHTKTRTMTTTDWPTSNKNFNFITLEELSSSCWGRHLDQPASTYIHICNYLWGANGRNDERRANSESLAGAHTLTDAHVNDTFNLINGKKCMADDGVLLWWNSHCFHFNFGHKYFFQQLLRPGVRRLTFGWVTQIPRHWRQALNVTRAPTAPLQMHRYTLVTTYIHTYISPLCL